MLGTYPVLDEIFLKFSGDIGMFIHYFQTIAIFSCVPGLWPGAQLYISLRH